MNMNLDKTKNMHNPINKKKSKKKKRIFYLDQIRALAIVLVVLNHTCSMFIKSQDIGTIGWLFPTICQGINILGVPLFLMISGALLLNREYELKDFFKRRFIRIILPLVFWGMLLIITDYLFGSPYMGHTKGLLNMIIWFFNNSYWFCWMLIGIYLFIPVINSFIKEYEFGAEYFLLVWLVYIILTNFKLYPLGQLDLSYFAGYMGFLVLGYYIQNKEFNISDKHMFLVGILIIVTFTALNSYLRIIDFHYSIFTRKGIIVIIQCIGIFLFFKYFAEYSERHKESTTNRVYSLFKDTVLGKLTFSLSICSYGIYLTHYYFLHIGCVYLNKNVFTLFSINPIIGIPLIFLSVLALSWVLIIETSKIPHLKKWSGIG